MQDKELASRSTKGTKESTKLSVYSFDTGFFPASRRFLSLHDTSIVTIPKNAAMKNQASIPVKPPNI